MAHVNDWSSDEMTQAVQAEQTAPSGVSTGIVQVDLSQPAEAAQTMQAMVSPNG